ncbi:transposase domain-containing protein [Aquimarina sp. RZ0]
MLYSFFATCKINNVDPYTWLKDILEESQSTRLIN